MIFLCSRFLHFFENFEPIEAHDWSRILFLECSLPFWSELEMRKDRACCPSGLKLAETFPNRKKINKLKTRFLKNSEKLYFSLDHSPLASHSDHHYTLNSFLTILLFWSIQLLKTFLVLSFRISVRSGAFSSTGRVNQVRKYLADESSIVRYSLLHLLVPNSIFAINSFV